MLCGLSSPPHAASACSCSGAPPPIETHGQKFDVSGDFHEGSMQCGLVAPTPSLSPNGLVQDEVASIVREEMKMFRKGFFNEIHECFAQQTKDLLATLADAQNASATRGFPRFEYQRDTLQSGPCKAESNGVCQSSEAKGSDALAFKTQDHSATCCHLLAEDDDDEVEDLDGLKLKIDGAFGQIFAKDDTDLEQPHFRVEDLYSQSGWAQAIARSEIFQNVSLAVISTNAVYLGIDCDYNDATTLYDAHPFFIIAENLFCAFFFFELLIRILAFRSKCQCCKDGWFRFDSVLLMMMVLETWIMAPVLYFLTDGGLNIPVEPIRLVRLLRLTRMARLMRTMPEIVTMTKGILISSRAVLSAMMMVLALVYVHAIVMKLVLEDNRGFHGFLTEELNRNFETIPWCMWTLLLDGTFMMDGAAVITSELLQQGTGATIFGCFVFMFFMLTSAVTVMNMLIGILCRVVDAVSAGEMDDAAIKLVKESILVNLKRFDNGAGMISRHELAQVMFDPISKKVLKNLNVDRLFMMELQRMLFPKPDSQVPIREVMELIVLCRGDLPASVKSLSSGLSYVSWVIHKFESRIIEGMDVLQELIKQRPGFTTASSPCFYDRGLDVNMQPEACNDAASTDRGRDVSWCSCLLPARPASSPDDGNGRRGKLLVPGSLQFEL